MTQKDVPTSKFWSDYPELLAVADGDMQLAALQQSPGPDGHGKFKPNGELMCVWEDFVAGTDPQDETDVFMAKISVVNGEPVVTWSPALNDTAEESGVRNGIRTYRVYGSNSLGPDALWSEVSAGDEPNYSFFKVSVAMP